MSNQKEALIEKLEEAQVLATEAKHKQVLDNMIEVLELEGSLGNLGGEVLLAVTERLALAEEAIDQLVRERDEARKLVGILLGQLKEEASKQRGKA